MLLQKKQVFTHSDQLNLQGMFVLYTCVLPPITVPFSQIIVFQDVMLCSLVDRYRHFTGRCYVHLQGRYPVCQTMQCQIP
jgi:hypothetical protein